MIEPIKINLNYQEGIFGNSSYKNIVIIVNKLIEKSNEQTKVINRLIEENKELKEKISKI